MSQRLSRKYYSLQYTLILLFLVLGISLPCSASAASEHSSYGSPASNWVVADFDGDHKLDVASVRQSGGNGGGSGAQLHVALASSDLLPAIALRPLLPSIDIAVSDLDGDGDLDIVVGRADIARDLSREIDSGLSDSIRVWINDGHGSFTETSPTKFPLQKKTGSFKSRNNASFSPDFDIQQLRHGLDLTDFPVFGPPASASAPAFNSGFSNRRSLSDFGPHQLRAPPSPSTT